MNEKILKIEKVENQDVGKWSNADGYFITTDKQVIKLMIENGWSCCENWGYFMSEDDLDRFVNADLYDITLTDTSLNTKTIEEMFPYGLETPGSIMFVNLDTSEGLLQFTVYNDHNGYYGHSAYVISEQLNHEETL
jgi:hypothetical protein